MTEPMTPWERARAAGQALLSELDAQRATVDPAAAHRGYLAARDELARHRAERAEKQP